MSARLLDATGLRCPQPVMRVAATIIGMATGETLEVVADCPTFEEDIKKWAQRLRKTVIITAREGARITARIEI